ncbi:angiopoietin-2b isoform X2 [Poecilia latipinna]|uniref:angiopoietin-2b isoform X2 n=1 Tax=Poecilia formosa TaxID=48698 RepID=UPI000444769E|nr:PREDICTED: angiopoietin-2-like isoform X2 [Poecilia formosa]XP_014841094.1 PREDICTED: angiopoietin-2-like isoform X2 [Poecilia mexicana]XP_014892817.1 PREDICTED: angiopoietin-2-like isoform X2 [Poecilia latipinna]
MGHLLSLTLIYLAYLLTTGIASQRQQHRVQHGPCTYTFILPEVEHCKPLKDFQVTNTLQRDSPPETEPDKSRSKDSLAEEERPSWQRQKLETLESAMENNTQWLQKLENFIQENVRSGVEEIKRSTVHTQTAAMLEMGTNLLSQSAEQTRKLTDVETQVLNQTSRLEIQLLEYSLFTNRLEKRILLQTQEISRLSDKNSFLEQRLLALEARYGKELQDLQGEKQQLQDVLERQSRLVSQLEEISNLPKKEKRVFRDCAEILRSGAKESGVYSIRLHNSTQDVKVYCDMKTRGGGWTVLQHRRNGSVDFHRSWNDYKMGFGEPSGEHWLGNDIIHKLTSSQEYSLHIQLRDREGNEAYSHYDRFHIDKEVNNYSLHADGFSGTAGKTSSLTHTGSQFSTKDRDNDRCTCKCAQLASGGWWFDACGPSNLNGIYYPVSSNVLRFNGIKWYYWKGPNLLATMTTMMVRPADFR